MNLVYTLLIGLFLVPLINCQFYPLTRNENIPENIEPYELGQEILMDCISRNIDTGEHKFDSQDRIVYTAFPSCKETGQPLTFKYGINEDVNCTINFSDELYHLFQLYIHEDVPFSCRIPLSTEQNYLEKGGAFSPLTFNFRGEIRDSHLDIDQSLNVIFIKPSTSNVDQNTVISSVAFSSSTNVTRVVIGDDLTLNLAIRWYDNLKNTGSLTNNIDNDGIPFKDGFYMLPLNSIPMSSHGFMIYLILVALASSVITLGFSYNLISIKFNKHRFMPLDQESTVSKQD